MFKDQINTFSENLAHLRDFVDTISEFLLEKRKDDLKLHIKDIAPLMLAMHKLNPETYNMDDDLRSRVEANLSSSVEFEITDEEDGHKSIKIEMSNEKGERLDDALRELKKSDHRQESLYSNSLISLISTVEWFIAQLIHQHYKLNPHVLGSKDKQFSLDELGKFETIDDAKNYLIEKTVESVLRGSIDDWFEFFKLKLNLSMGYLDDYKKHLIEAAQRRNLLVHNGGVVNRIYLANFANELGTPPVIGEKIEVTSAYINETISLFERCFILIAAELWKKINKEDESRGDLMITLGFDHLQAERYDIAESLSYFAFSDKTLQEKDRLYAKINYWIAKKYSGQFEKIKKEIENEDFSAKSKLFILAKNILLDNYDDAILDINYLLTHDDEFVFEHLEIWPLFRDFRLTDLYQKLLHEKTSEATEAKKVTKTAEAKK